MFNFVRVFFVSLLLFSGSVFSNDYYYWAQSIKAEKFDSPMSACLSDMPSFATFHSLTQLSETHFSCMLIRSKLDNYVYGFSVHRYGSICPPGTEYNSETGECVPPPNDCEVDETTPAIKHEHNYGPLDANGRPISLTPPPPSLCDGSCKVNFVTFDGEPYYYTAGNKVHQVFIETWYARDGNKCEVGDPSVGGSSGNGPDCRKVVDGEGRQTLDCSPPRDDSNECPKGWQWSGTTCVRSPDNPPPDPIEPPEGGGDGDGSSGDNGTGGDGGDKGDGSGGDNGPGGTGGSGSGSGNGSGNGSGDGDGDGDGDGTKPGGGGIGGGTKPGGEGEGEGGTGEGVDNCESGRCDFGDERGDPFGGEVRSFSDSLSTAMSGMKNSPLGSSISNIQFPTGGTCPVGETSINLGIGVIPISFSEHCNLWDQISPLLSAVFLALWAIIAIRVFLSA